jgi:hypothetical protein
MYSLDDAMLVVFRIFASKIENEEIMKVKTLFTKVRADYSLVDSFVNLFIKDVCDTKTLKSKKWSTKHENIGSHKSLSTDRRVKRSSSKEIIKRAKSENFHCKAIEKANIACKSIRDHKEIYTKVMFLIIIT